MMLARLLMLFDLATGALRQVSRDKRVAVIVIATVGAATALAGVLTAAVGSVLTARLPLVDNERVTQAFQTFRGVRYAWSYPQIQDFVQNARAAEYAGAAYFPKTIPTPAGPQFTWFEAVTTNYPDVMGVHPSLGRWFRDDENREPLRDFVVVLSDELCRKIFTRAEACIGSTIQAGNASLSVIGVMPRGFRGAQEPPGPGHL